MLFYPALHNTSHCLSRVKIRNHVGHLQFRWGQLATNGRVDASASCIITLVGF
jgi:hypothetical protein